MRKIGGVWVDDQSYYDKHKDIVLDLGKIANPYFDLQKNTLLLTKSEKAGYAKIVYFSPKQKLYTVDLGLKDNGYLLLRYFADNVSRIFRTKMELEELGERLKTTKTDIRKGISHYDRIRYTLDYLRDLLKLKENKDEDPFVSKKGFGIKCLISIKM